MAPASTRTVTPLATTCRSSASTGWRWHRGIGRAAHIHRGTTGEHGPVVANIAWPQGGQSADCIDGLAPPARFVLTNSSLADADAVIADILANPQNCCVNVHNSKFPGGAVRGQLAEARL